MGIIKLLFYKDGAIIVSINLMTGNYFIPTIESSLDRQTIKKMLMQKFHVAVDKYDHMKEKETDYLFIGEWEGMYGIDDEALRSKWVPIKEVKDENLFSIRERYRDIVDRSNQVIGIATIEEAEKYNLRYRVLEKEGTRYPFILGESLDEAKRRLDCKGSSIQKQEGNLMLFVL